MFKNVILKTLYDKRSFMIGWSFGLVVMAGITIVFFPTIKDQIGSLFSNVPKSLQAITGSTEDYKSIVGYIGTAVFDLRIPMLTVTMAIILGLGIGVSEEASGKLYQLLAQPLSRTKIVLHKWVALATVFAVVHVALGAGIVGANALIHESIPLHKLVAGLSVCYLLTLAVGSLTLGCGLALGRKGLTTLLITTYVFGSYLLTSFAAQIDWLKHVEPASLFHYYKASEVIKYGASWEHMLVLIAISVMAVGLGALAFSHRDVGTHSS